MPYLQIRGRSYCFSSQHLHVVYASPRLLVVDTGAPYLLMRLISAHAPAAKDFAARTYPREAATQFKDFLSHDDMTSIRSIGMIAKAAADTWTSHSTNVSYSPFIMLPQR